jgi:hypothetical protein
MTAPVNNPDSTPGLTDSAEWPPFSGVVSVCHCADMEPHVHLPMTDPEESA